MAAAVDGNVTAYAAIMPVVRIGALEEFAGIEVPSFDPRMEVTTLALKSGFLVWETADTRVDYRLTEDLYYALLTLKASVMSTVWPGLNHSGPPDINAVTVWLLEQ